MQSTPVIINKPNSTAWQVYTLTLDEFAALLVESKVWNIDDDGTGSENTIRKGDHPEHGPVALATTPTGDYYMLRPLLDCSDRQDALKVA